MKRLKDLPEIAARQLGGLEATPKILAKAKLQAAEMHAPHQRSAALKPVLAICTALVLCVGAAMWTLNNTRTPDGGSDVTQSMLDSRAAGDATVPTEAPRTSGDVPVGSISMSVGGQSVTETLFAQGAGGSFPLITMNGATYRMLQSPSGISSGLLGDTLGEISEFNVEPALGSSGIVSNVAALGETVYAVSGMNGALVAANVEGTTRVFQRVSYAGTAIIGSESLRDTLCDPVDVEWIELSGYGRLTDTATAQSLIGTLLDGADYLSTGMSGSGSLQIGLKNGLTLQLLVGDETVSACGTWSCPDFFEAVADAEWN